MRPSGGGAYQTTGYAVVETDVRVPHAHPDLVTRFRWRAERRARRMNAARIFPSYRMEVVRERGRWHVVAFQNRAVRAPSAHVRVVGS